MKKKYLAYVLVPVFGLALFGVNQASARGFGGFGGSMMFGGELSMDEMATHHETMFKEQAVLLSVSVDTVKKGWAEGKSLWELAEANSITKDALAAKMKEARTAQAKTYLQTLVAKGIITQAQADQHLIFMQNHEGKMGGMMPRGFSR
ncbi:MAG: hypothetical protein HYU81_00300 [Candidatus Brennerbacteria bacterium]|nr:hypothetical protein [Candidatus Brennerbacteria bacterium]